jgi:alpha-beta hydrolase superfamily lysophospholipase
LDRALWHVIAMSSVNSWKVKTLSVFLILLLRLNPTVTANPFAVEDYTAFDKPEVLSVIFHPRPEIESSNDTNFQNLVIPVTKDIKLGGRAYGNAENSATVLFFHGNGEIAADYRDIASSFLKAGLNFVIVDYRGYGKSNGSPTVTTFMSDSDGVYEFVNNFIKEKKWSQNIILMGRSLGSALAIHLANRNHESVKGLIIDSGFASGLSLLQRLGLNTSSLEKNDKEKAILDYREKISRVQKPTLIIHGEQDQLIPLQEAKILYQACAAKQKKLLVIPLAGHNSVFKSGPLAYMQAIKDLVKATQL